MDTSQTQATLTVALMAAFADGLNDDRERASIKQLTDALGAKSGVDLPALYREVLLQKRPPRGIWGGLWSLPEVDEGLDPARALRSRWGLAAASAEALPAFEHAFTHYTLEVAPWLLRPRRASSATESGTVWLPLTELAGAALPSPVKRLLARL